MTKKEIKEIKRYNYDLPFFLKKLEKKNNKKYKYIINNYYGWNYSAHRHKPLPPYNFLTKEALNNKDYKKFVNPWYFWNSRTAFNFLIDWRGTGKTKALIRLAFALFYKDPTSRFIWITRYETTTKKFLASVFKNQAMEAGIDVSKFTFHYRGVFYNFSLKEKVKIIDFISITAVDTNRFNSYDPKSIRLIIFDEFIPKSNQYIPNEINNLFDQLMTILRTLPLKWNKLKIIFSGNNISENTPYHSIFKLPKAFSTQEKGRIIVLNKKFKYSFFSYERELPQFIKDSLIYNITSSIFEDEYAFGKTPLIQNKKIINKIPKNYNFWFNLFVSTEFQKIKLGVFFNKYNNKWIVHSKHNSNGITFIFNLEDYSEGIFFFKKENQKFLQAISESRVYFENTIISDLIISTLKNPDTVDKYYDVKKML